MNLLKLALPTAPFRQPLRTSLLSASRLQIDGVHFDIRNEVRSADFGETAGRQLRHYLDELRLKVAAVSLPTRYPLCDSEHLDLRIHAVKEGMNFARRLGTSTLCVRLGLLPGDVESREFRQVVEIVSDLAAYGDRVGTMLALSTVGNSAERIKGLCQGVSTGAIGVDVDPAGFAFDGLKGHHELRELHGFVQHVSLRDGMRTSAGTGVETAVGAGEVDWEEFLATLAEMEYRGWLTPQRTAGEDQLTDITRAITYIRAIMQQ